jgi:hypothetical protein
MSFEMTKAMLKAFTDQQLIELIAMLKTELESRKPRRRK